MSPDDRLELGAHIDARGNGGAEVRLAELPPGAMGALLRGQLVQASKLAGVPLQSHVLNQSTRVGHPILRFLIAGVGGSYALLTVLIFVERGRLPGRSLPGYVGLDMEEFSSLVLVVVLLASALWSTWRSGRRPAVRQLFSRVTRWRVPLRWWVGSALALPVTTVAFALLFGDTFHVPSFATVLGELVAAGIAFLLINLWEETAWVGFMQTQLERRRNFLSDGMSASASTNWKPREWPGRPDPAPTLCGGSACGRVEGWGEAGDAVEQVGVGRFEGAVGVDGCGVGYGPVQPAPRV